MLQPIENCMPKNTVEHILPKTRRHCLETATKSQFCELTDKLHSHGYDPNVVTGPNLDPESWTTFPLLSVQSHSNQKMLILRSGTKTKHSMEHATKETTAPSKHIFEMITGTHPKEKINISTKSTLINFDKQRNWLQPRSEKYLIASVWKNLRFGLCRCRKFAWLSRCLMCQSVCVQVARVHWGGKLWHSGRNTETPVLHWWMKFALVFNAVTIKMTCAVTTYHKYFKIGRHIKKTLDVGHLTWKKWLEEPLLHCHWKSLPKIIGTWGNWFAIVADTLKDIQTEHESEPSDGLTLPRTKENNVSGSFFCLGCFQLNWRKQTSDKLFTHHQNWELTPTLISDGKQCNTSKQ